MNLNPKKSNHDIRLTVVNEILSTEKSYVESLQILQELYIIPLLTRIDSNTEILSSEQISVIFSSVQVIKSLNGKFLGDIQARIDN